MKTTPIPVKFDRQGHSCNFYGGLGPTPFVGMLDVMVGVSILLAFMAAVWLIDSCSCVVSLLCCNVHALSATVLRALRQSTMQRAVQLFYFSAFFFKAARPHTRLDTILAEGAIALSVTLSGGALFAS